MIYLKREWPIMLDKSFTNVANAKRPNSAKRFAHNMMMKIEDFHERILSKWEQCGLASYDDDFDALSMLRGHNHGPFKRFTKLTDLYKDFIDNQIMGHCKGQTRRKHFVSNLSDRLGESGLCFIIRTR